MKITARQRSAEAAGFRYFQIPLKCGATGKEWVCPQYGTLLSVERAMLSHFQGEGWRGFWGEGGLLLTLIKAMSFAELGYDERTRYIEALYTLAADPQYGRPYKVADLLEQLSRATPEQVARNFDHMDSRGPHTHDGDGWTSTNTTSLQDNWPGLEKWMALELLAVAGVELLHHIAIVFATNPYEYRRGWPDITMWKNGQLRFVEVKAPGDTLGRSQKVIATSFARLLELDFSLVDVMRES